MNMKKSALAIAVCSGIIMTGSAMAEQSQKFANKTLKPGAGNKQVELIQEQISTTWLVKAKTPSLVQRAKANNRSLSKSKSASALASINSSLSDLENEINKLGLPLEIINRTTKLASALVIKGDQDNIKKLESLSQVAEILPVYDYKLNVADSAKYINATPLVSDNIASGKGVRVAVLDTGVDYTHAAIGGAGTAEAYAAATADPADTPAWPIGNVVGGWDFINGDPDPIDVDTNHGTHVTHSVLGIAPEASIYAYSVCGGGCPGAAQLAALEAAMDPNNDGDISDRVDVINMSLGGDYGTSRGGAVGDLLNQAVSLGVVATISAGNDGAYPYIVGGPSTTDSALSVGAMTHPTEQTSKTQASFAGSEITALSAAYNTVYDDDGKFSIDDTDAQLIYPDMNQEACEAFATGVDFKGKAVILDRGSCAFVTKTLNAQAAGAEFVIVANNREGGAFFMSGSNTGIKINSIMVSQEDGDTIKAAVKDSDAVKFSVSAELQSQAGAIASFTSRGPSVEGVLKPEITAPGVSIMTAHPGLGDGLTPASGTSFSGPITAGAMALLAESMPDRNALELKATIMNSANLDVTMEPRGVNPDAELAPISYIGAGLVDVEKASKLPVAAWATDTKQAALSFGFVSASSKQEISKSVSLKNFSNETKLYTLKLAQRYENDIKSGALSMDYPTYVRVPPGQTIEFDVTMTIDPSKLHAWTLDDEKLASRDGSTDLTVAEYDGALNFIADGETAFHLVYHVLPKAYAELEVSNELTDKGSKTMVTNTGAVDITPVYEPLTVNSGVDSELPSYLDMVAGSVKVSDVSAELCDSGVGVESTVFMRDGILSPNVAGYFVDFDLDSDGTFDYTVQAIPFDAFDRDNPTGVTVSFTRPYTELRGGLNPTYHVSGNNEFTMLSCLESFNMTADDLGKANATVAFRVENSAFNFFPQKPYSQDMMTTGFTFAQETVAPKLVDADGKEVKMLAKGKSAYLKDASGVNAIMTTNAGGNVKVLNASGEVAAAPVVAAQTFDIDENSANGTVVGTIKATDANTLTSPVSEIYLQSSSSNVFAVSRSGVITVANQASLDFDSGLESATLEVVAIDTKGNVSKPAQVTVNVNNLVDTEAEKPVVTLPQGSSSTGGGALSLFGLLLLPLTWLRRKKVI